MEKEKEKQEVKHPDWKCFIGLHKYEVLREFDLLDIRNNVVGKVIVNRCIKCGKINKSIINTVIYN